MPSTPAPSFTYRVVALNEAGTDYVSVTFTQEFDNTDGTNLAPNYGGHGITLTLPNAEAASYFPGQKYTVSFTLQS